MNKHIKELAGQLRPVATIGNWGRVEWSDNVYPQLDDKMYAFIDLEKFAELIIRECLTFGDIEDPTLEHAHSEIKTHFGVK